MNKKWILVVTVIVLIITSLVTLTGCGNGDDEGDKVVYDAGEYGQIREGSTDSVDANDGYRFIDWSEPIKKGNKIVYKAQYEHAEYYLSEIKDIYICPYDAPDGETGVPLVMRKVTNMQTQEEATEPAPMGLFHGSCSDERCPVGGYMGPGKLAVGLDLLAHEFDGILTITIDDTTYHVNQEMQIHIVRNRIAAESIEISGINSVTGEINTISNGWCILRYSVSPKDTSFVSCKFNIIEVVRDEEVLSAEQAQDIAYIDEHSDLCISDKAKVGDIIRVQAYNLRDPDVKSNILSITVY